MHLVQLLLPVSSPGAGDDRRYVTVRSELTQEFGGVTAYLRAPATGLWRDEGGGREWWGAYRERLETRFAQKEIHLRAIPLERL